jgi:hypothetical protein
MTIAADDAQQGASHRYQAMRDFVQSMDDTLPGKFEITKEGTVHDLTTYPLLGIPVYAIFDPRTATGATATSKPDRSGDEGTTKSFRCSGWSTPARHPTPRPPTLNAWQKRPAPSPGGPSSPFPLFGTGPPVSWTRPSSSRCSRG